MIYNNYQIKNFYIFGLKPIFVSLFVRIEFGWISSLWCLMAHKIRTKSDSNWFCAPIIFWNPLKNLVFNKKYTFTICLGCVWIVIRYFLFEKHAFNGLLQVIGIQKWFNVKWMKL